MSTLLRGWPGGCAAVSILGEDEGVYTFGGGGLGASCPILYRALSSHTREAVESHEKRAFKSATSPSHSVLLHVCNVVQTCEQSTGPSVFEA